MFRKFTHGRNTQKVMPRLETLECRTVPAVLFQNGNWITGTGNGFGGANTSEIESTFVSFGFTASTPSFHVADDFAVPSGVGWSVAKFRVYAYSTGAPANINTFTALHLKLYNGEPGAGGAVILDCSGANAIDVSSTAVFTNVYRVEIGDTQNNERAVKQVTGSLCAPKSLMPGTYWFEWALDGSGAAPRANVTVPWDITDNGKQLNVPTGIWGTMADPPAQGGNGSVQDIPFEIIGRAIYSITPTFDPVPQPIPSPSIDGTQPPHKPSVNSIQPASVTGKTAPKSEPVATRVSFDGQRVDELFAVLGIEGIA